MPFWMALAVLAAPLPARASAVEQKAGPGDAVKQFYESANRGAYAEARKLFAQDSVRGIERVVGSFRAYCDSKTMSRTMSRIEIVREDVRGNEADVRVRVTFTDGLTIGTESLVRENESWKLSWMPRKQSDSHWRELARLAETQGHRADAWIFYRMAAALAPQDDAVVANIRRMWSEIGGSEAGLRALAALEDGTRAGKCDELTR